MCLSKREDAALRVLTNLAARHGKRYVFPSQATIVRLCKKRFSVTVSRRHLNRVLASLESQNYFERKRRHCRTSTGSISFHSTLYILRAGAFNFWGGLARSARWFFDSFRVPRVAQYIPSPKGGSVSPVDNLGISDRPLSKGAARGAPIFLQIKTV